jgi:MoaA/NifB/PqqE/SkfB family radical SAM enzyme
MNNKIIRLEYEITYRCNFKCRYCYLPYLPILPKENELKTYEVYNLIDSAKDLDIPSIHFTGGEPLLRNDIFDILEYSSKKLRTVLETNASLIDFDVARKIRNTGIDLVRISLDSFNNSLRSNIRGTIIGTNELLKVGQKLLLVCDIHKFNKYDFIDVIRYADNLKISYLLLRPVLPVPGKENYSLSPKELKKIKMDLNNFFESIHNTQIIDELLSTRQKVIPNIDPYGNVRPMTISHELIGNIRKNSLEKILDSYKF